MAKDKKSFLFYCDWIETFNILDDEQAGKLIKHLLSFVNDEHPETDDPIIKISFAQIKATLERDLEKYKKKIEQNRQNALKRWGKKDGEESDSMRPHADNERDNDNGNDIDNGKDSDSLEKNTKFNFRKALKELGCDSQLISEWIKVRTKKRLANTQTALRSFIREQEKSSLEINEVLTICVENSWGGFKAEWIKNNKDGYQENSRRNSSGSRDTERQDFN